MPHSPTTPLYLCGPMASGRSALAISLAKELNGEIVNADLYQAYRGFEILSAAPSEENQAHAPHHFYGILDPTELCDPAAYRALALPVIGEIQSRGKLPVIVGGTSLYLKTLTHGSSSIPQGDPALREKLEARSDDDLFAELTKLDPEGAERTDLKNRRYLMRALEICLLSGQKMSALKADENQKFAAITRELRGLYLLWENENLKQRISSRSMQILEKGGIEEVKALRETASATARKIIGFREIEDHLDGKLTLKECHKGLHSSTRRFAKRQRAWLKKEGWLKDVTCPFAHDAKVSAFLD